MFEYARRQSLAAAKSFEHLVGTPECITISAAIRRKPYRTSASTTEVVFFPAPVAGSIDK